MKQPTQEQIKEFWEWCGFKHVDISGLEDLINEWEELNWESSSGEIFEELPPIDLNNLFKYAVPFINEHYGYAVSLDQVPGSLDWYCQLVMPNCSVAKTYRLSPEDPALALFWALDKVREDK